MDHEGCIQADLFARGEYYDGGEGREAAAVSENCAISVFSLLFGQCRANVHVPRPRTRGWNNLFRVVRSNIYFRVRNIWWQEETVRGGGGGRGGREMCD